MRSIIQSIAANLNVQTDTAWVRVCAYVRVREYVTTDTNHIISECVDQETSIARVFYGSQARFIYSVSFR